MPICDFLLCSLHSSIPISRRNWYPSVIVEYLHTLNVPFEAGELAFTQNQFPLCISSATLMSEAVAQPMTGLGFGQSYE